MKLHSEEGDECYLFSKLEIYLIILQSMVNGALMASAAFLLEELIRR